MIFYSLWHYARSGRYFLQFNELRGIDMPKMKKTRKAAAPKAVKKKTAGRAATKAVVAKPTKKVNIQKKLVSSPSLLATPKRKFIAILPKSPN